MPPKLLEIIKELVPPELHYGAYSSTPSPITAPNPAELPTGLDLKIVRHYPQFIGQLHRRLERRLSERSSPLPTACLPRDIDNSHLTGCDRDIEFQICSEVIHTTLCLARQALARPDLKLGVMSDPGSENPSTLLIGERDTGRAFLIPVLQVTCKFNNGSRPVPNGRHLLGQLQQLMETHGNIVIPGIYPTNLTEPPWDPAARAGAELFDDLILPEYGAPERVHITKPLRHVLQQSWKEMTLRDMAFAVITEYDYTFFLMRDRKEQTLYISDRQSRMARDPSLYCTMLEITCRAYEDMDYRRNLGANVETLIPSLDQLTGKSGASGTRIEDEDGDEDKDEDEDEDEITFLDRALHRRLTKQQDGDSSGRKLFAKGDQLGGSSVHATRSGFRQARRNGERAAEVVRRTPFLSVLAPPEEINHGTVRNELVVGGVVRDIPGSEEWRGYLDLSPDCCSCVYVKQGRPHFLEQEYKVYCHMAAQQVKGVPSLVGLYMTARDNEAYLLLSDEGHSFEDGQPITAEERELFREILHGIHNAGILHNDLDYSNLVRYGTEGENTLAIAGFHVAEVVGSDEPELRAMAAEKLAFDRLLARSPLS